MSQPTIRRSETRRPRPRKTTPTSGSATGRVARAAAHGALAGVLTAGVGLGAFAVAVLALWTASPYPDGGPDTALRSAAGLWLLAHGADLTRPHAGTGSPVPIGLTPLLLTVLPVWLLHRAGTVTAESNVSAGSTERRPACGGRAGSADGRAVGAALTGLVSGYCLIAVAVSVYTASGAVRGTASPAALLIPLLAAASAGAGARSALCGVRANPGRSSRGAPAARRHTRQWRLARLGGACRRLAGLPPGGGRVAVRAALATVSVLVCGGALISTGSLLWRVSAAQESYASLGGTFFDRLAVLLLCAALAPNAFVWGTAYALGSGFTVGTGTAVGPFAVHYPALPDFPLLAAVPPVGATGPWSWAVLLVPLGAGWLAAAVIVDAATTTGPAGRAGRTGRAAMARRWSVPQAVGVALAAAAGTGALTAAATALAAGPVGSAQLASFGPHWGATGVAAFCWTAAVAAPAVVIALRRAEQHQPPRRRSSRSGAAGQGSPSR